MAVISKVLEIKNCKKEIFLEAIYKPKLWEELSPVNEMKADFVAPNVLHTNIVDYIKVVNIPIEMEGELVLVDKGEEEGRGRLIEFNVRNNKDIKELDGNIRVKALSPNESKIGVFIHNFELSSNFLNLFGSATELVLRTKITALLRNLEKYCKSRDLKDFL